MPQFDYLKGSVEVKINEVAARYSIRARMAHPACPWPFGTVIRPIEAPGAPWSLASRHMVIGPLPSDPTRATLMFDLINKTPVAHLNEGITERWVGIIEAES